MFVAVDFKISMVTVVYLKLRDTFEIDQDGAVEADEFRSFEYLFPFLERAQNQNVSAVAGEDPGVGILSENGGDFVNGDSPQVAAISEKNETAGIARRGGLAKLAPAFFDRPREPFLAHRLNKIIERFLLEGLHGEIGVGCDEDHRGLGRNIGQKIEAVSRRQLDIEKQEIDRIRRKAGPRLLQASGFGHDSGGLHLFDHCA